MATPQASALKSFSKAADPRVQRACRIIAIVDAQTLSLKNSRTPLKILPILNTAQAKFNTGILNVLHLPCREYSGIEPGHPTAVTGEISARSVTVSVELALLKLVDAIVHAPISKYAWKLAGVHYPGHTELIARLSNTKKYAMAITSEPLRTVMVTRHIPLSQVPRALTKTEITDTIELTYSWLKKICGRAPRLAVCALNPHAGEKGLIGTEEIKIIRPAIIRAEQKLRAKISGPLPADSAYRDHKAGHYDGLVTLYHDQSLIPLKLFNSDKLINITLGLPFPRTSPGHGTAFEIAGQNKSTPEPMIQSILTAVTLCKTL